MYQFQYDIRPGRYRHFKGNELWVRPAAMWAEVVERDGRRQPRFAYIGE